MYVCLYVCIHASIYGFVCMHACTYLRTDVEHIGMHRRTDVGVHVCMHVRTYTPVLYASNDIQCRLILFQCKNNAVFLCNVARCILSFVMY